MGTDSCTLQITGYVIPIFEPRLVQKPFFCSECNNFFILIQNPVRLRPINSHLNYGQYGTLGYFILWMHTVVLDGHWLLYLENNRIQHLHIWTPPSVEAAIFFCSDCNIFFILTRNPARLRPINSHLYYGQYGTLGYFTSCERIL